MRCAALFRQHRRSALSIWQCATLQVCCTALLLGTAHAHAQTTTAKREAENIHRCEGPPVFFTSDPRLIRAGRCEPLGNKTLRANPGSRLWQPPGTPAPAPRAASAPTSAPPTAAATGAKVALGLDKPGAAVLPVQPAVQRQAIAAPPPPPPPPAAKGINERVVTSAQQKERDSDRVAILRNELDSEQRKLAELRERLKAAQLSAEPNKVTRIASVQKDITRTESDIQALTREVDLATR